MTPTKRNKRKSALSSDSDENESKETDTKTRRQSCRISDKRHRPEFRLPSRDEIWNDIPSMESIRNITPRKSVNNFTKIYNDYNYDDYDDDTSDETSSVETSDSDDQKKRQHRIKNFHTRFQMQSSSSDDDGKLANCDKYSVQVSNSPLEDQDRRNTPADIEDEPESEQKCDRLKSRLDPDQTIPNEDADFGDSDGSEVASPCKRSAHSRNRSFLDSDDESSKNDNNDGSGGDNGSNSQLSDSSDLPVESRRCRVAKQKLEKINLFKKFRDAQAKRNKSVSST